MSDIDVLQHHSPIPDDSDPAETAEWLESFDYVLEHKGPERVKQLLGVLEEAAHRHDVELPFTATTPYINTISRAEQPAYPGDRELERRIKSYVRWNAMAMVTRANQPLSRLHQVGTCPRTRPVRQRSTRWGSKPLLSWHVQRTRFPGDQIYLPGTRRARSLRAGVSWKDGSPSQHLDQLPPRGGLPEEGL